MQINSKMKQSRSRMTRSSGRIFLCEKQNVLRRVFGTALMRECRVRLVVSH